MELVPETYSVKQCAKVLNVGTGLVYQLIKEGRIHAARFGRRIIIPRRSLEILLNEGPYETK